jgi:predicted phosphoribosyltransferase
MEPKGPIAESALSVWQWLDRRPNFSCMVDLQPPEQRNEATLFSDRRAAGRLLAHDLESFASLPNVVVLALPRGGVPVGYEVARALDAPLDVFVVRKLGVPGYEELAMGAIASGGVRVINDDVVQSLRIPARVIDLVSALEAREIERREHAYRGMAPPLDVGGATVILVDDGLATGATMRAAVASLRARAPARIVVAVPTAARDSCADLRAFADEVICSATPHPFGGVGRWYNDFSQTSDDEVRQLLSRTAALRWRHAHST